MIPALTKEGLEHLWLHIVARIGKMQQQITDSLGSLATKDTVSKSDLDLDVQVSLGKADSAIQVLPSLEGYYNSSNQPPYPVTSVNGQTGAVILNIIPAYSTLNNDQFLKIVEGIPTWVSIQNAEGGSF